MLQRCQSFWIKIFPGIFHFVGRGLYEKAVNNPYSEFCDFQVHGDIIGKFDVVFDRGSLEAMEYEDREGNDLNE